MKVWCPRGKQEGGRMGLSDADIAAIVKQLPIPVPWDRAEFVARIARRRGRPITLIPVDTSALIDSPCGLWLSLDGQDLLLHASGTTEYHIDHIVNHEIGHMVLDHDGMLPREGRPDTTDLYRQVLPDLDPAAVNLVLARGAYNSDQEHEAEQFANEVMLAAADAARARSTVKSVFLPPRRR